MKVTILASIVLVFVGLSAATEYKNGFLFANNGKETSQEQVAQSSEKVTTTVPASRQATSSTNSTQTLTPAPITNIPELGSIKDAFQKRQQSFGTNGSPDGNEGGPNNAFPQRTVRRPPYGYEPNGQGGPPVDFNSAQFAPQYQAIQQGDGPNGIGPNEPVFFNQGFGGINGNIPSFNIPDFQIPPVPNQPVNNSQSDSGSSSSQKDDGSSSSESYEGSPGPAKPFQGTHNFDPEGPASRRNQNRPVPAVQEQGPPRPDYGGPGGITPNRETENLSGGTDLKQPVSSGRGPPGPILIPGGIGRAPQNSFVQNPYLGNQNSANLFNQQPQRQLFYGNPNQPPLNFGSGEDFGGFGGPFQLQQDIQQTPANINPFLYNNALGQGSYGPLNAGNNPGNFGNVNDANQRSQQPGPDPSRGLQAAQFRGGFGGPSNFNLPIQYNPQNGLPGSGQQLPSGPATFGRGGGSGGGLSASGYLPQSGGQFYSPNNLENFGQNSPGGFNPGNAAQYTQQLPPGAHSAETSFFPRQTNGAQFNLRQPPPSQFNPNQLQSIRQPVFGARIQPGFERLQQSAAFLRPQAPIPLSAFENGRYNRDVSARPSSREFQFVSAPPPCARNNASYCTQDRQYPFAAIMRSIELDPFTARRMLSSAEADIIRPTFSSPVPPSLSTKAGEGLKNSTTAHTPAKKRSQAVCNSRISTVKPLRAQNTRGHWKVIVNLDQPDGPHLAQIVRIDECTKPNGACNVDVKSYCEQKFSTQRLTAWSPLEGLHMDSFKWPVACTCVLA